MKSLHVCVQSLMCKVFCEITSCLCAIPDVQLVCDVCIYNWTLERFPLSLISVVSFLAFGQLLNVAMTVWTRPIYM